MGKSRREFWRRSIFVRILRMLKVLFYLVLPHTELEKWDTLMYLVSSRESEGMQAQPPLQGWRQRVNTSRLSGVLKVVCEYNSVSYPILSFVSHITFQEYSSSFWR